MDVKRLLAVATSIVLVFACFAQQKLPISEEPISLEHIEIYRAFFNWYLSQEGPGKWGRPKALMPETEPLALSGDFPGKGLPPKCLNGFVPTDLSAAQSSRHRLPKEVSDFAKTQFVTPDYQQEHNKTYQQNGRTFLMPAPYLAISEVAVSHNGRLAVVSFADVGQCPLRCGSDGVIVLEKKRGNWNISNRQCKLLYY
jgi:hypothetical protein